MQRVSAQLLFKRKQLGTAWLCSAKYALTAAHCLKEISGDISYEDQETEQLTLCFPGETLGPKAVEICAKVLKTYPQLDVALLQVLDRDSRIPSDVRLGEPSTLSEGDLNALWNAFGYPRLKLSGFGLTGTISAVSVPYDDFPAIQLWCTEGGSEALHDDPALDGASGSAVYRVKDGRTEILGIVISGLKDDKVVFARSLQAVREQVALIDDILSGRTIRTADTTLPKLGTVLGRERETGDLCRMVQEESVRVVTVHGVPGIGTSMLINAAAERLRGFFPSGVFYVDLETLRPSEDNPAAVQNPEQIFTQKLTHKLGISSAQNDNLLGTVIAQLVDKRVLLVFDNLDQIPQITCRIAELVEACPSVQILLASPGPLEAELLGHENSYKIQGLEVPDPAETRVTKLIENPSFRVFAEQAKRSMQGFDITTEASTLAVAELCRRAGGHPGTLVLLAAQAKQMSASDILNEWKNGELPPGWERAFSFVYKTLARESQRLFHGFSLFKGGCSRRHAILFAAKAVGGESSQMHFSRLLDRGLVEWVDAGASGRYRIPRALRQFGLARLAADSGSAELVEAYSTLYLDFVEEIAPKLTTGQRQQAHCMEDLKLEEDNLREVLDRGIGSPGKIEVALQMAGSLFWFWNFSSSFSEGIDYLSQIKDRSATCNPELRGHMWYGLGGLHFLQGNYEEADRMIKDAVQIFGALIESQTVPSQLKRIQQSLAYALVIQGMVELFYTKRSGSAEKTQQQSRDLMKLCGDRWGEALAINDLARAVSREVGYTQGSARFKESLKIWQEELKDDWGTALCLSAWADAAQMKKPELAIDLLKQALDIYERTGDLWGEAQAQVLLGKSILNARVGSGATAAVEEADTALRKSLHLHQVIGRQQLIADCYEGLGDCAAALNNYGRAAFLYGAAEALRLRLDIDPGEIKAKQRETGKRALQLPMSKKEFQQYLNQGAAASEIVAFSKALETSASVTSHAG